MAQKRHVASWAARRKMQGVTEALTSTWRTVTVEDRFVKELSRQPENGSAYSHHAPWHVAPDGGYGSRSQWQPLISLLCGGWHGVGYPCPALPLARPVHHLPVVARTADAKENGGVIEVNYS